jgi:hypothetical protein
MSSDTSTGIRTVTIKDRQKTCRTCVEYDPEKEFCLVSSTAVFDPDIDGYACPDYREAGHTCRKCRHYTARYVSEEEGNRAMCLKKMVSIRDPEACGYDCRMYEEREQSTVEHPPHYNTGKIEVLAFVQDQSLNFCRGNVIKYLCRAGKKPGADEMEDLRKAKFYLDSEIERLEGVKLSENI